MADNRNVIVTYPVSGHGHLAGETYSVKDEATAAAVHPYGVVIGYESQWPQKLNGAAADYLNSKLEAIEAVQDGDGKFTAAALAPNAVTRAALGADVAKAVNLTTRGFRVAAMGDSITAFMSSWYAHLMLESGGRVVNVANAGRAGDKTAQMLARFDDEVLAYAPDWVIVFGGTNDVGNITPAQTVANLNTMYDKAEAAGARVIAVLIPPIDFADVRPTNRAIYANASARGLPMLDMYSLVVDAATGDYISGWSDPLNTPAGVHPTQTTAQKMGQYAWSVLSPLFAGSQPYLAASNVDSDNLLLNGLFITDANSDGLADSWAKGGAGTNYTASLDASDTTIKGKWQTIEITGSGAVTISQSRTVTQLGAAVGDVIRFSGRQKVGGMATGNISVTTNAYVGGANKSYYAIQSQKIDDSNGVFCVEFALPPGVTGSSQVQFITTITPPATGTPTGTIKLAQWTVVNLSKAGS